MQPGVCSRWGQKGQDDDCFARIETERYGVAACGGSQCVHGSRINKLLLNGFISGKCDTIKYVSGFDVSDYSMEDVAVTMISPDVGLLTYMQEFIRCNPVVWNEDIGV